MNVDKLETDGGLAPTELPIGYVSEIHFPTHEEANLLLCEALYRLSDIDFLDHVLTGTPYSLYYGLRYLIMIHDVAMIYAVRDNLKQRFRPSQFAGYYMNYNVIDLEYWIDVADVYINSTPGLAYYLYNNLSSLNGVYITYNEWLFLGRPKTTPKGINKDYNSLAIDLAQRNQTTDMGPWQVILTFASNSQLQNMMQNTPDKSYSILDAYKERSLLTKDNLQRLDALKTQYTNYDNVIDMLDQKIINTIDDAEWINDNMPQLVLTSASIKAKLACYRNCFVKLLEDKNGLKYLIDHYDNYDIVRRYLIDYKLMGNAPGLKNEFASSGCSLSRYM